jgi:hypothetical protein
MNTEELKRQLRDARIRTDSYSLDGETKDEALVLEPTTGNGWRIYYSERGLRTGEKVFITEEEACESFLEIVLRDPLMRESQSDNASV